MTDSKGVIDTYRQRFTLIVR